MIGRAHRFHGHKALNGVYQRGKTVRGEALGLRFALRNPGKPYRVAVVVSRKVSRSAVVRNRIRRRVYAAVREAAGSPDCGVKPGTDLVFTAFSAGLAELPAAELKESVSGLLRKTANIAAGGR